jgi:multisubunit Na+/H+ antiporter MnhC subunit
LTAAQRNGHDAAYATVIVLWALLLIGCLATWTVAGVMVARRLEISSLVWRLEAVLGAGVALSMVAMMAGTAIWWAALARSAPWFLAGAPTGTAASPLAPALLVTAILMLIATTAASAGAVRALRAASDRPAR